MLGSALPIIIHIILHGAKQCRIFIAADSGSWSVPLPIVLHKQERVCDIYSRCQLLWLPCLLLIVQALIMFIPEGLAPVFLKLNLGKPRGCLWGSAVGMKGEGAECHFAQPHLCF